MERFAVSAQTAIRRRTLILTLLAGALAPAGAMATCQTEIINQRTVVTATLLLGTREVCSSPVEAFPPPFTCPTEIIGRRSGGNDSFHQYDTTITDLAECLTSGPDVSCYADGGVPPSGVPFQCIVEVRRDVLDVLPATAVSACGCASLKRMGD